MSATHLLPPAEQWRAIPGYEGSYEASACGKVRSLARVVPSGSHVRRVRERVLAARANRKGRLQVDLYAGGRSRTVEVHRLVLLAFVGPCPEGLEGCHNDGDHLNNTLGNLRWDTRTANNLDTVQHGHHHLASRTQCPKGHEFSPENTRVRVSDRARICRTCQRDYFRQWRAIHRPRLADRARLAADLKVLVAA